jgi:hypothetical protein
LHSEGRKWKNSSLDSEKWWPRFNLGSTGSSIHKLGVGSAGTEVIQTRYLPALWMPKDSWLFGLFADDVNDASDDASDEES